MQITKDSLASFLDRNNISKSDWEKAKISIDNLNLIAKDYADNVPHLNESAEFLAKVLQKCKQVHSVRWRVKDPEHLLEKIIRKRASGSEKYQEINDNNYFEIITDLVGVRILHLFKYEWLDIHSYILSSWKPLECVKAYIREGDEGSIIDSYKENGCDVEPHPSGYRSIHYIISTQPTLKRIISEIQVRTIFEEGWSEIDHKVRYPNFSDNKLISYFLTIFNRMAGSADEMGTFVKDLTAEISLQELRYRDAQKKHEAHLSKIESLALQLSKEKRQNRAKEDSLEKLNNEIEELRRSTNLSDRYASAVAGLDLDSLRRSTESALAGLDSDSLRRITESASFGLDLDSLRKSTQSALAGLDLENIGRLSVSGLEGLESPSRRRSKAKKGKDSDSSPDDND
tara:strand:- start:131 stop:1330 length:1200 start_codon:yes stop_codon:yes gene_type:complete